MKVLLVVNSDIGRGNTIGFRFGKVAKELKKQGIDFDIIARANYDQDLTVKTPIYKNYLGRLFNFLHIYITPKKSYRKYDADIFDRFVLKILKKNKKQYDIVHFGEYAARSISFLKASGSKVFLDIPIGHYKYVEYLQEKKILVDMETERDGSFLDKAIAVSDALIVPSQFVTDTLTHAGFDKKIFTIPFGSDFEDSSVDKLKKDKYKLTFMFAGSVGFRKGIKYLLEAWKFFDKPDAKLVICGRIYKEVKPLIHEFSNFENIEFTGFVNTKPYFVESDVFILPSLLEGSSKAIYEAMSHRMPTITTPNAGSIVMEGESGFIVPVADSKSIKDKMEFFYQNKDKLITMGSKAREQVKDYTWEKYATKVVSVYKNVLSC